jgi:hypothetical protein
MKARQKTNHAAESGQKTSPKHARESLWPHLQRACIVLNQYFIGWELEALVQGVGANG